ncbi:MAG TPA: hypothetical protein VII36_07775 [Usitatibacter sp.]
MTPRIRKLVRLAGWLGCSCWLAASAAPPAPAPCSAAESRQFDFWVGDWDVYLPNGKLAGTNRIERIYGCVLHESWKNEKVQGQSFNAFDADRGVWHQTWVDSMGSILLIEGAFRNGAMSMSDAALPAKKDPKVVNEITWTPQADGSVRQHWRVSPDGGKTWNTSFDGKYVRSSRPQPS